MPKSHLPRKQRKAFFNKPLHQKRKNLAAHLSPKLIEEYNVRAVPLVKGDTVKVVRGGLKGLTGKVSNVSITKEFINVEKATMAKADGKTIPRKIHPSNVVIIKLNLSDPWRKDKLEEPAE